MAKIQVTNLNSETQIQQLDGDETLKIAGGTVLPFKLGEPVLLPSGIIFFPTIPLPFPPSPPPQPNPPGF